MYLCIHVCMYAYTYVCMHTRMYVCIHSDASSSFFPPPVGAAPTAAGPGDEVSDEVSAASGAWPERFAKVAAVGERGGGKGGASVPTLVAQKGEGGTTLALRLRANEVENNDEVENNSSFRWGPLVREPPRGYAGHKSRNGSSIVSNGSSIVSLYPTLSPMCLCMLCFSKVSLYALLSQYRSIDIEIL